MSEEQSLQNEEAAQAAEEAEETAKETAGQTAAEQADEAAADLEELLDEPSIMEQLAEQLAAANKKSEENWELVLRTRAEMENLRRRTEKEIQDARKFALERFSKELLVVVDSLELGIQAAVGDAPEVVKLREGGELTLKQFLSVLEKYNVVPIEAQGQKFNPELHQAMAMEPSDVAEPNTVLKVFQKGYTLNDRLLRPALVVVAQKP